MYTCSLKFQLKWKVPFSCWPLNLGLRCREKYWLSFKWQTSQPKWMPANSNISSRLIFNACSCTIWPIPICLPWHCWSWWRWLSSSMKIIFSFQLDFASPSCWSCTPCFRWFILLVSLSVLLTKLLTLNSDSETLYLFASSDRKLSVSVSVLVSVLVSAEILVSVWDSVSFEIKISVSAQNFGSKSNRKPKFKGNILHTWSYAIYIRSVFKKFQFDNIKKMLILKKS